MESLRYITNLVFFAGFHVKKTVVMLYVFTENRKNNRSYNTSTRNRQEQNLATFWVLNRGRRGMLEFEFRLYFKTFHVRTLLWKKEQKRK